MNFAECISSLQAIAINLFAIHSVPNYLHVSCKSAFILLSSVSSHDLINIYSMISMCPFTISAS